MDIAPNNLVGCVIQKRFNVYFDFTNVFFVFVLLFFSEWSVLLSKIMAEQASIESRLESRLQYEEFKRLQNKNNKGNLYHTLIEIINYEFSKLK